MQEDSIAMQIAQELGILKQGDLVVQTAGTLTGISGSTDLIKVGLVRKVVTRGISIGELGVTGKARNINEHKRCRHLHLQRFIEPSIF